MNRRYVILSGLCVFAAVAAGCAPLRGSRPDAPVPPPLGKTNPAPVDTSPSGPGRVVPTSAIQPSDATSANKFELTGGQPVGGFQSPPTGQPPLAPPRQLPPGGTVPIPPIPATGAGPPGSPPGPGDPHQRTDPTVYGGRLTLGPNEVPTDRVLELTRNLEFVLAQNRDLVARIKDLERQGIGREQALVEAIREVEAAEVEVAKTRGVITTQKSEIASLQDKIRQLEREDIELLKLVIKGLEKLLPSERREP